jgi:PAS domain S-box-containing protein
MGRPLQRIPGLPDSSASDSRRRARATIIAVVVAGSLLIVGLWAAALTSIAVLKSTAVDHAQLESRNLAAAFADEVAHTLDGVSASMDIVAQRMRADPDRRPDIYAWAHEIRVLSDATVQGAVIGPDGWLISSTLDPNPSPLNLGDREHFRVHLDGQFKGLFIGPPVVGRLSHQTTIQVSRRVDTDDGKFLGVIVFSLSPASLTNDLNTSIDLGVGGVLSLAGLDNIVRARFTHGHPDGLDGVGASVAGGPRPQEIAANAAGSYVRASAVDHILRSFTYHRVRDYPLVVQVGLEMDGVLAAPRELTLVIIAIAAGTTLVLLGLAAVLIREIRRRAATEVRLRETMADLDRAQRLSHTGSNSQDLRTNTVEWSAETCRIFGVDPKTFTWSPEKFLDMVVPEDRPKVLASREESAQGHSPTPFEYRIRRPDGEIRCIQRISETVKNNNGVPIRVVGTDRDVTELREGEKRQKELEHQLLHSQKLEAVGTLAGGIAHELNNALQPILIFTRMILDDLPPTSELREEIEAIASASRRAQDLVQGILAFSRKQEIPKGKIDLARLVHQALTMLRATLPTTTLIKEEIASVPPVLANADQLQQVIVNLVTNASHAIGTTMGVTKGTITIAVDRAPREQARGDGGEEFARIRIADTGCGMDAATIEHIFEPFYTTKEVGVGTGLGLSVVHGIVTDHGGRIEVDSTPGKGTEFSIYLPLLVVPERLLETAA